MVTGVQGSFGTMFRTVRLAEFVAVLWLLSPWWGRRDMLILRCHLRCLYVSLGSVALGLLVSPGRAFAFDGRLTGAIWPMFPTQIAQYAAIAAGLTIVLWLAGLLRGRPALIGVAASVGLLLLTHTRTALVGLIAGILVAGLSLFVSNKRVRRFFAAGAVAVSVAVLTVAGIVTTWLARGQNAAGLASLSGRTAFWNLVLIAPRDRFQEIFGFGLSNASINGLPIDSNWLSAYMQEGIFGVVICAMMVVFLLVAAFFQPPGVRRALALFIITYCLLASYTEDAFTNASTYLLNLVVAASLLVAGGSASKRHGERTHSADLRDESIL
jgi:O-antigen ligase